MKTKHTKGEWKPLIKEYPNNPKEIYVGIGTTEELHGGIFCTMICDMILPATDKEYIKQHEEIEANAKLIAAAPDLLERLKGFVDRGRKLPPSDELELAELAIKKATE